MFSGKQIVLVLELGTNPTPKQIVIIFFVVFGHPLTMTETDRSVIDVTVDSEYSIKKC